jgi:hypothetical protein
MLKRMIGASLLRASVYEEVERATNATLQAALVVVMVSITTVLGSYFILGGESLFYVAIMGIISGLVRWAAWAFVANLVGTKLFNTENTHSNWGQMARGTAFAQTPGVLLALCFIPGSVLIIAPIVTIWQCTAMIVAVKQVLDYDHLTGKFMSVPISTWRAIAVVAVGLLIVVIPILILTLITGVSPQ